MKKTKNDHRSGLNGKAFKDAIARAVEEKNKSDAIIAALGVGIIVQDTDYKIIFQNQVQNDLYGDRTGQYCYRAYEGRDSVCENCPVELTFKDGKNHRAEKKVVTYEGINYYELISSPLKDHSGKIIAGIKLVKDITEQKRAEEALRQSEEKYRLLIDNIHDGVFIIQDANIQFANKAFTAMTGYTIDEMVGKNFQELVAPEDLEMVTDRYYRRQKGEYVPREYEFNMLHRDGMTRILVNMNVELITYRGRIASMGTVMDITDRKSAEMALYASEKKYSTLVEKSNDGIVIVQDGLLKFTNPMVSEITGFNMDDIKEKQFMDFIFPSFREIVIERYVKRMSGEDVPNKYEIALISKDGKSIPVEVNASVIDYENRPADMAIIRDIKERKQMEDKLRDGESFLENIFGSIQDGIGIIDSDMNIIRVNETAKKWYPHAMPIVGKKCYQAYHDRTERCESCPAWKTIRTGESFHEIIPKHGQGGREIGWLEIYSFPLKDTATGEMRGVIEYVRDITERKHAEETVRLFSEAVENAYDGVQITDLDGYIIYSNKAVERMYGFSHEELIGIHVNELNVDPEIAKNLIIPAIKEKGSWIGEIMVRNKSGGQFCIWLTTSIVKNSKDEPIALVGIIRDITERKSAEEVIKKYAKELEGSNRMKELFIDIMHHDLLNPINTAYGFIEILKESETLPQKKVYLDTVKRNLMKAMELIENASQFSKLETLESIEFEDLDIKDIIKENIENIGYLASMAGMRIENNINENLPVKANRIIEDVFANILSNAIKYDSRGKRIVISCEDKGDFFRIRIMDFGRGIKDDEKLLLFERFRRVEKKGIKGSGLGLAIAKKVMDLHNGRILIEDNPDGGAVFIVDIPKSQAKSAS